MKHYKEFSACLKKPKSYDKMNPSLEEAKKRNKKVGWKDPLVQEYLFYPYRQHEVVDDVCGPRINNETYCRTLPELNDLPSPVKRPNESERDYRSRKSNKDCKGATCKTSKDELNVYPRCLSTEYKGKMLFTDYGGQQDVPLRFDRNLPAQMQKVNISEETDYKSKRLTDFRSEREYIWEKISELEGDWV